MTLFIENLSHYWLYLYINVKFWNLLYWKWTENFPGFPETSVANSFWEAAQSDVIFGGNGAELSRDQSEPLYRPYDRSTADRVWDGRPQLHYPNIQEQRERAESEYTQLHYGVSGARCYMGEVVTKTVLNLLKWNDFLKICVQAKITSYYIVIFFAIAVGEISNRFKTTLKKVLKILI